MKRPERLGEILNRLARRRDWAEGIKEQGALSRWEEAVEGYLAGLAERDRVRRTSGNGSQSSGGLGM